MIYFLALIPATALTIAGYFVLFLSSRTDGSLRTFGRYLGFWAFTLAGLVILGAIFAAAHHGRERPEFGMRGMHRPMPGPWSEECPGGPLRPHRADRTDEGAAAPPPPGAAVPPEPASPSPNGR